MSNQVSKKYLNRLKTISRELWESDSDDLYILVGLFLLPLVFVLAILSR